MSLGTKSRGFASMDSERQREIARKGGRAAHEKGTAHEFTADEARAAGKKGGERVSTNREHMSRIGRLGGKSSAGRRSKVTSPGEHDMNSVRSGASGNDRMLEELATPARAGEFIDNSQNSNDPDQARLV